MKNSPQKTLIVGGGYIALETAGFLSGLGLPVTLMTRNKYLKGIIKSKENSMEKSQI